MRTRTNELRMLHLIRPEGDLTYYYMDFQAHDLITGWSEILWTQGIGPDVRVSDSSNILDLGVEAADG